MSYLVVFSRCLIGLVFALSALEKARSGARFRDFRSSLTGMRVLPAGLAAPVAAVVVAGEAAVPLLLAPWPSPIPPLAGFVLAALLLGGFTVAIAIVLGRGTPATCRCFGGEGAPFGRRHVVRNLVLAAVAATGAATALGENPITLRTVVVVPVALFGAVLVARLDDLAALFTPAPAARR